MSSPDKSAVRPGGLRATRESLSPPWAKRDATPPPGRERYAATPVTPTLSEHASKQLLAGYDVPLAREEFADSPDAAAVAAARIGFPVVAKLCGEAIAHKTERDLVRLGLGDEAAVRAAATELLAKARPEDGEVGVLVAELVRGKRELIAGLLQTSLRAFLQLRNSTLISYQVNSRQSRPGANIL